MRTLLFLFILLFGVTELSYAARGAPNKCEGWFTNLRSPICTNAKYVFWSGTFLTAAAYATRTRTGERITLQADKKRPLGNGWPKVGDTMGLGFLNIAYALHQAMFGGKGSGKNIELMAEASAYSGLLVMAGKRFVSESRPGAPDDKSSFPSGHTAMAFTFASVVGARHNFVAGALAYITAAYIGYTRVHDKYHHFHDILAGATIGAAYGLGIHYNHKNGKPYWFGVLPTEKMDGAQLAYGYSFK